MTPLYWLIIGLTAISLEIATGTGFLLWFGLSAAITAIVSQIALMVAGEAILWQWQLVIFGITALLTACGWWKRQHKTNRSNNLNSRGTHLIGRIIKLNQALDGTNTTLSIDGEFWEVSGQPHDKGGDIIITAATGGVLSYNVIRTAQCRQKTPLTTADK